MHITRRDCLALNEAVLVNARVNRVSISGFQIATTVFFDMPACFFVALCLAVFTLAWPGLRGLNRCCINDIDAALCQNNVLGFKLTVDLSQKTFPQVVFNQVIAEPTQC